MMTGASRRCFLKKGRIRTGRRLLRAGPWDIPGTQIWRPNLTNSGDFPCLVLPADQIAGSDFLEDRFIGLHPYDVGQDHAQVILERPRLDRDNLGAHPSPLLEPVHDTTKTAHMAGIIRDQPDSALTADRYVRSCKILPATFYVRGIKPIDAVPVEVFQTVFNLVHDLALYGLDVRPLRF